MKQLHYNFSSETLQSLALKLGCKARSLFNQLRADAERVSTNTLSCVSEILNSVKTFVSWIDRYPFCNQTELYMPIRRTILLHSIELASTAQRDQFVENPNAVIKAACLSLADLCDRIVTELNDSLTITPATLEVVGIKKRKDEDIGLHIYSSYTGIHMVGAIKDPSPSHRCGRIEEGDEIIQVRYQTVVGWQLKNLVSFMKDSPTEILLTLKKRPRHSPVPGQMIVVKPQKLRTRSYKNSSTMSRLKGGHPPHLVSSQLAFAPEAMSLATTGAVSTPESDEETFESSYKQTQLKGPVHPMHKPKKSRHSVRRRATISGSSPTMVQPPIRIEDLVPNSVKGSMASGLGSSKKDLNRTASQDPNDSCDKSSSKGGERGNSSSSLTQVPQPLLPPPPPLPFSSTGNNSHLHHQQPDTNLHPPATSPTVPYAKVTPLPSAMQSTSSLENATVPKQVAYVRRHSEQPDPPSSCTLNSAAYASTNCHPKQESSHPVKQVAGGPQVGVVIPSHTQISSFPSPAGSNPENHHYYSVQPCHTYHHSSFTPKKPVPVLPESLKQQPRDIPPPIPQRSGTVASRPLATISSASASASKSSHITRATRCVPCKSLAPVEYQGWLLQLKETKGFIAPSSSKWLRRWVILKQSYLYCFKTPESPKADCLINLPGFVVAPATECKVKKYVFKVYSLSTSFQFAAESVAEMSKWISKIGFAAISYSTMAKTVDEAFFSESDASEGEISHEPVQVNTCSHKNRRKSSEHKSKYPPFARDVSPGSSSSSSSSSSGSSIQNVSSSAAAACSSSSSKIRHQRSASRDEASNSGIYRQHSFTSGSSTSRSSDSRRGHSAQNATCLNVKSTAPRVTNISTDVPSDQPAFGRSVSCLNASLLSTSRVIHKQQQQQIQQQMQQQRQLREQVSTHTSNIDTLPRNELTPKANYVKLAYPAPCAAENTSFSSFSPSSLPPPVPARYAELDSMSPSPAFPPRSSASVSTPSANPSEKPKLPDKPGTLARREPPTPLPRVSKLKNKAQTPPPPPEPPSVTSDALVKPLIVGAKEKKSPSSISSPCDTNLATCKSNKSSSSDRRSTDSDLFLDPLNNHVIPNEHGKRLAVAVDPNIFAKSPTDPSSSNLSILDREYNRLFGNKSPNELQQAVPPRSAVTTTEVVADLYGLKMTSHKDTSHQTGNGGRTLSESDAGLLRSQSPISDHSISSSSGISSSNNSTYIDSVALLHPSASSCLSNNGKNNLAHQVFHSQDFLNQSEASSATASAKQASKPVKSNSFRLFHSPKLLKKFSTPKYHKERRLEKRDTKSPAGECATPKADGSFFNFGHLSNSNSNCSSRKSAASISTTDSFDRATGLASPLSNCNGTHGNISAHLSSQSLSPSAVGGCGGNVSDSSISDKSRTSFSTSSLPKVQRSDSGDWTGVNSPDAPKKPTMGVTMIKKKRASNVSTDKVAIETALLLHQQGHKRSGSSIKSDCNEYPSCNSPDTEEEWSNIVKTLQRVGLTVDKSIKSKVTHTRTASTPTSGTN